MSATRATRSYAQLCGIATGLDLIGDRWALLIVRDLLLGPLRFSELAGGLPGIGTNTLTTRLTELEADGIVARRLLARPDRGTRYELTEYGRQLEPILMALGRWGSRSMDRLPGDVAVRSRWLVAAMLAFHDPAQLDGRSMTWELRLRDGVYTAATDENGFTVHAGAPAHPHVVVTLDDSELHGLLAGRLTAKDVMAAVVGKQSDLERLIELCRFR